MEVKATRKLHQRTSTRLRLIGLISLGIVLTSPTYAQSSCPDGRYTGRPSGSGQSYYKDHYTWAVTREFATRFCMPEEFISDDLKGAEAIAYWHGRPTGQQICRIEDGKENCQPSKHGHWIELYVKTGLIKKFDPAVQYFVRNYQTSGDVVSQDQAVKNALDRDKGAYQDPFGVRPPFFGLGTASRGGRTIFSYLARTAANVVEVRAAGFTEHYYQENWYQGIDLIALEGRSNGSIAGRQYPDSPRYGYGIGIKPESSRDAHNHYPDAYQHIIELPKRVTEMINKNDQASGAAFESAVRAVVDSMRK